MTDEWRGLIENLQKKGVLKKPIITDAFLKTDRKEFIPEEYKEYAYADKALPILERQTISQPYTVAFMLDLLNPEHGNKILDIGAGSGWQTALLARISGSGGHVYAMEIIPELCEFGKNNLAKHGILKNVEWFCRDASKGLAEKAPFDRIIAAASLAVAESRRASLAESRRADTENKVLEEWLKQLKTGGRLVTPIGQSIWLFVKNKKGDISSEEYPGFAFVPFK